MAKEINTTDHVMNLVHILPGSADSSHCFQDLLPKTTQNLGVDGQ
jgi:hypothetical protein